MSLFVVVIGGDYPFCVLCCSALAPEVCEGQLVGSRGLGFALCWWLLASAGLGHGAGGPPSILWGGTWVILYPFLAGYTLRCREGACSLRVTLSLRFLPRLPGVTLLVTFPLPLHSTLVGIGRPCWLVLCLLLPNFTVR